VGEQGAKQSLAIDPVGLDPTPPARSRNRGCIDNMALNSFAQQDTVNPEAVQPRFLNDDNRAGFTLCLDIFSPRPGDSDVTSQVDRLSSNEMNIAKRSAPIVVGVAD
jgi:hypothetical protein